MKYFLFHFIALMPSACYSMDLQTELKSMLSNPYAGIKPSAVVCGGNTIYGSYNTDETRELKRIVRLEIDYNTGIFFATYDHDSKIFVSSLHNCSILYERR